MKIIYKISAIIFCIGFVFIAFVSFALNSIVGAVLCIIAAIFIPMLIIRRSKKPFLRITYTSREVTSKGFQFLESIYLIQQTKNQNTFVSRVKFIYEIYPYLAEASKHSKYSFDVQHSLSEYNRLYPKKEISAENILILLEPNKKTLDSYIDMRVGDFS